MLWPDTPRLSRSCPEHFDTVSNVRNLRISSCYSLPVARYILPQAVLLRSFLPPSSLPHLGLPCRVFFWGEFPPEATETSPKYVQVELSFVTLFLPRLDSYRPHHASTCLLLHPYIHLIV